MIIRDLRKEELYKDVALSCMAGWCKVDLEEEKKKELETLIVGAYAEDGETLMSKIGANRFKSSYCGEIVNALGIGGVATAPMYRRSGGVRAIFQELFNRAEQEGWVFSYLYPFSFNYYRQFGYERILHWNSVTFSTAGLQHLPRCSDNVKMYEGEETVLQHLLSLYNEYAARYEVAFQRDTKTRAYSDKPHLSGRWTFYTDDAYVTVEKKDSVLWIQEIVYKDLTSLTTILSFLRMFDGQVESLKFVNLPEHSEVDYLFADYGNMETCQYNGFMGRVVLVEKALSLYTYPSEKGSIAIKVLDPQMDANNGVFSITYENGKALSVTVASEGAYDIEVTIPALTRLLLGDVPVYANQMAYIPGITWNCSHEKVRSIFQPKDARIYDFF